VEGCEVKIVNREEFMKMDHVIFAKYESIYFGQVMMKHENCTERDFYASSLFGDINSDTDGEFVDMFTEMENGKSHKMVVEYASRDGLFEDDEKYLIFEKEDLKAVIGLLNRISND
jgi:hypothetical protein